MRRKRTGINIDMPQLFIIASVICLTIGVCAGAVMAYTLNVGEYAGIADNVSAYLSGGSDTEQSDVFKDAAFKYGKNIAFIWLLGFAPFGTVASLCILLVKGAGLGFSSSILIKEFGVGGIIYIVRLYLFQNLLLLPAYLFITYYSIAFAMKKRDRKSDIVEYLLALAVCAAVVVVASLIETLCVK